MPVPVPVPVPVPAPIIDPCVTHFVGRTHFPLTHEQIPTTGAAMNSNRQTRQAHRELTVGTVGLHIGRTQPDKIALYDGSRTLTYGQLEKCVDDLARSIKAAGVAKGEVVAVYLPNCIDYIVLVLAVARVGAIFSPLNPRFKEYEINKILIRAQPSLIFTTQERAGTVLAASQIADDYGSRPRIISIDGTDNYTTFLASVDDAPHALSARGLPAVDDSDYFSLMFTSGTTGNPKGVLATHRARMLWVVNAAIQYGLNEDDVYLGAMPQIHSAGLTFTLIHLYVGATVRLMDHFEPDTYLDIVEHEKVTSSLVVPTILGMLLEARERSTRTHDLSSLKRLVSCGSPLPLTTKRRVIEGISDQLYDYYGSTESNSMSVLKPKDQLRKPNSVGQPFTNVEIRIVSPDGRIMPTGEVGEVQCLNPSTMDCYLGDDSATQAAFTGHWFHTGDVGRVDEDGFLYLIGREKDIIVSGGVNIYPGEVEQVMLLHPAVSDCAVVGVDDAKWGQTVKAFVSLHEGRTLTLHEAHEHCKAYLADYKKPRSLEILDDLPKNASGKTIKIALGRGPKSKDQRS
ncbi:class I adenylate-forming enzyme family protein [Rhodococcus opacus]|uniref:class I adenylate-forming enzyme family protein n=1 Tax=Rhodococcus opacus TaxID=37919 RepID=UPI002948F00C|nr:AMP-binding protein [Rhodococcus opacus]MDV6247047.1 AMP-binding protein [Rhodococcus opacus]